MTFNEMISGNNKIQVAVIKMEAKEAKNGKIYTLFTLGDGVTTIEARMWENPDALPFKAGVVLDAVIEKSTYNDQASYLLKSGSPSNTSIHELLPHAPVDMEKAVSFIRDTIEQMADQDLKALTAKLFKDNEEKFLVWTAAAGMHHNYSNGLLYHTYRMLQSAQMIATVYPVNKDLLFAAVILHDLAKIKEYDMNEVGAITVTPECTLFGHLVMGVEMINAAAIACSLNPETSESIRMLKHCLLAHHGKLEYGSPVMPAIKEAMLLHELDTIDARMWRYETEEEKLEPGTISDKVFGMNTRVYKPAFPETAE